MRNKQLILARGWSYISFFSAVFCASLVEELEKKKISFNAMHSRFIFYINFILMYETVEIASNNLISLNQNFKILGKLNQRRTE